MTGSFIVTAGAVLVAAYGRRVWHEPDHYLTPYRAWQYHVAGGLFFAIAAVLLIGAWLP